MFKDELGAKIIIEFCAPRVKTYLFKTDNDIEKEKAKGTNKCIIKRRRKIQDCYDSVFKNEIILRSQLRFKGDHQTIYTENVNKIAIGGNDNKKIPTYDKVHTCPHGTNVFKVCQIEQITLEKYLKDE